MKDMREENTDPANDGAVPEGAAAGKVLSEAAKRALAEAAERRKAQDDSDHPLEYNGPKGKEQTRFGDWERKGIAYDF